MTTLGKRLNRQVGLSAGSGKDHYIATGENSLGPSGNRGMCPKAVRRSLQCLWIWIIENDAGDLWR